MLRRTFLLLTGALFLFSFTEKKETVWVAVGDSITYLNDHPDETGNRVTKGYLSRVTDEFPNLRYINQGHNGWKSSDIANKIEDLGLVKADVYTVFLGTNDWWGGRPVGNIDDYKNNTGTNSVSGSFRIIIDKLRQLNKEAKIVLITPMQRNDFVYLFDAANNAHGSYKTKNGLSLEAFANAVTAIGKLENIPVIDLFHDPLLDLKHMVNFKRLRNPHTGKYINYRYPKFTKIPFDPKNDEYPYPPTAVNITYDGLHPSDRGNEIIAKKVANVFRLVGVAR
ncbi:SGNH/GDSL hydrolase family protein [Chitinophaga sp. SYP-B3965]|uniref:SGNH/GDSL hydrolase family protein n=1 Tax=Chitinophaga sp. SYP-B3965 TaxID=2663120 RepID=UPI001299C26F|nr:SGNH/GDSL hydrolase family protein [Chitinophaga sp. SYP-B3965]MRG48401.1 SGNH/GDSL hydrolase family protein [Chitinophaga sp. SYP-B3965]